MTTLREAAQQALEALLKSHTCPLLPDDCEEAITALRAALAQQAEPDHETRAELAEQQVVQLAEERDHYRNLRQKAQQAEPVACCDLEERKALSSVKLPCDVRIGHGTHRKGSSLLALVVRSRSLYQMAKSDDYYGYASRLAVALWEKHYKDIAPQWKPLDDLMGVLTQIDNMTNGLTRLAQQAEPVEPVAWADWWRNHGQHNYRAKPLTSERVKELMKLAFEVGREAAPPQRKPLTDEDAAALIELDPRMLTEFGTAPSGAAMELIRRTERVHGIGGSDE